jgi:hypothetical protein
MTIIGTTCNQDPGFVAVLVIRDGGIDGDHDANAVSAGLPA